MRNLVVGTAGHIDHGKSSLVRALTGIDPDRLKEEKERGITIELGFAHTAVGDTRIAFVDVPGHERFVRTMLAGVGGIDCVLLIVAADESVMPQTREHFDICCLLRIPRGIVVVTKSDLADDNMRAVVHQDVAELVKGSFLETAPVIDVSAATGDGLDRLREAIAGQAAGVMRRPVDSAARLPIDRAFSMKGFGTVVTGTLVAGRIGVDDELIVEPGGRSVKVRGVQVHGRPSPEAVAGQRTAINLGGIDVGDVSRGETLLAPGTLSVTRRIDAEIDLLRSARPLKHGARVRVHNGTAEVLGRVSIAGTSSSEIAAGDTAFVRFRLETPAVLTRGDRFIIRAYSPPMTIGGGVVLDASPTRPGVRSAEGKAALERLRIGGGDIAALFAMIDSAALAGVAKPSLVSRAGVAPTRMQATIQELAALGVVVAGDRFVAAPHLAKAADRVVALVTASHKANAMSDGLPREEAREKIFARVAPAIFERVIDDLKSAKVLVGSERLALPTHRASVAGADDHVRTAIAEAYRAGGLKPPDAAAIESSVKAPRPVVEKVTALLLREKVLVRLDTVVFHSAALQQLKQEVTALKSAAPDGRATVDVAAFKDRYGVSRKYAIPLLEFLDRERVTRRTGDVRLIL
ncbi:MAG TPA: selenocysteine-specific translation elongation factor [Vicinamibacterales bacterium]|nr:selenocysteine-specific translation elongation factor [Vicinamibacterales bacterium]